MLSGLRLLTPTVNLNVQYNKVICNEAFCGSAQFLREGL